MVISISRQAVIRLVLTRAVDIHYVVWYISGLGASVIISVANAVTTSALPIRW